MSGQLASYDLAPSPSPGPTGPCDEPQNIDWLLPTLAATTALFFVTTILAVIPILFLMRRLRKEHHPQYQEKNECKYWEDPTVPTLKETLATDSKQPNVWYSMNTETFQHSNDGTQTNTSDTTGSNEVVPVNKEEKVIRPKRRAPPPPTKGRWGGWRKKHTAVPAEYEIPSTVTCIQSKRHAYMELDLNKVQPPSEYAKPAQQTSRK